MQAMQRTGHRALYQLLQPAGLAVVQPLGGFEMGPQNCQSSMQHDAAIARAQAFLRMLEGTRVQPVRDKGAKRTSRLILEHSRTSRDVHVARQRNSHPV